MKFKAKPKMSIYTEDGDKIDWLADLLDEDGYITGWYADGYLLGDIWETDEEYITFEWWVPVKEDTLKEVSE